VIALLLGYNKDSQNIVVSFVNGTAEFALFITQERFGLPENLWNHELLMWKINHKWARVKLPSMHLKLGLMKNYVKAMNKEEAAFTYL
jgi:hypothetical protein